ncbi:MAG: coiled coil domain-containing protein [bacterium]
MKTMEEYVGKMETRLKKWGARLDDLVLKADQSGEKATTEYHKRIDELKAKHRAARTKVDEMKAANSEQWKTFKAGIDGAWNELGSAYRKMTN